MVVVIVDSCLILQMFIWINLCCSEFLTIVVKKVHVKIESARLFCEMSLIVLKENLNLH